MKKYILYSLWSILILPFMVACSDDDPTILMPAVKIEEPMVTGNGIVFQILPQNSTICAYMCVPKGKTELTANQVLNSGTQVETNGVTSVTVVDLQWASSYVLIVAVSNADGQTSYCLHEFCTSSKTLPVIQLSKGYANQNKLIFNVQIQNAVKLGYMCYKENDAPPTVEEVMTNGTLLDVLSNSMTVTTEDLESNTVYNIMVVAESTSGLRSLAWLQMTSGRTIIGADLGEPANCYLITDAGDYHFTPQTVSGRAIEGIVRADWLWCTKSNETDTNQKLLDEVFYAGGRINFTTTGVEGNAVIAAYDADNTILWIWHIWCSDQPATMTFESGAKFMDRNLGATSANPVDGKQLHGLNWQWGRNVPFFGGYIAEESNNPFTEAKKWTIFNQNYNGPVWNIRKEPTDLAESFANPTTYFISNNANWYETREISLWSGNQKTDYDPCPVGYHLPEIMQWDELVKGLKLESDLNCASYTYNGQTTYFPFNGGRDGWDASFYTETGKFTLWSGTAEKVTNVWLGIINTAYPYRLIVQLNPYFNNNKTVGNYTFAHSVRCVAD